MAPDIQTAYARALYAFERNGHIRAMAVYGVYALQSISRDHITLANGFKIVGSFVHEQSPTATAVAMAICTLGPEIERMSRGYLAGHDMLMRVMKPLKSLSFMMAIGLRMAQWSEAPACGRCHLFSVCRYRKT